MGRIIRVLWYVLLGAFIVSMLTWMPRDWESVFNQGLAFSTLFLSITLITGMGGQLSLAQARLAGVGAFTAAQLANHLGLPCWSGAGRCGVAAAGGDRPGRGLAAPEGARPGPHDLAAALFFDNVHLQPRARRSAPAGSAP